LSGSGNNGTLINGPTFDTDNNGSILFTGDDICRFPASTFNSGAPQQGTFIIYIKFPPLSTTAGTTIFGDGGSTSNLIYFYRNSFWTTDRYSWLLYYNTSTGEGTAFPDTVYSAGTWYQTAMTFDETGVSKLYVNGKLTKTVTATDFVSWKRSGTSLPFLGAASSEGSGNISGFYYYNRALTAQEVKQHFNAIRGRYGI
jgi:hypothetical protein